MSSKQRAPPPAALAGSGRRVTGSAERPRLAVFRSNKHISAQVIDDRSGHTLASASTVEASARGRAATSPLPRRLDDCVAERANAAGVTHVVFDRGGFATTAGWPL